MTKTKWYTENERKDANFTKEQRAKLVFSPSLGGKLRYAVGRSKDRSDPAFAYFKLSMASVDEKGNVTPHPELRLGTLSSIGDLVDAVESADATPQVIQLRKDADLIVSKEKEGVKLSFTETRFETVRPMGAYVCQGKNVSALLNVLRAARDFAADNLALADADDVPATMSEETRKVVAEQTVYR